MSNVRREYEAAVEFHPGPTVFSASRFGLVWGGSGAFVSLPAFDLLPKTCPVELASDLVCSLPSLLRKFGVGCTVLDSYHCFLW